MAAPTPISPCHPMSPYFLHQNLVQILFFHGRINVQQKHISVCCSGGEVSQELIRGDSDFGLTPSQDTSRAGIQGLEQKLSYLALCPPVIKKMCENLRFLYVVRHFPVRKFKLPNPQEGALRCPNLTPFVEAKGIVLHISQQAGVHILTQALK